MRPLPFPAIVIASDDDPYVSLERAREYARAWGAEFVLLERAGHINVASGHGPWAEGYELLARLRNVPLEEPDANRVRPTPEPPYYAVIFTSQRTDVDDGYGAMGDRMVELASQQPGFLGVESVRDAERARHHRFLLVVARGDPAWKAHAEHRVAQTTGARSGTRTSRPAWPGWSGRPTGRRT